GIHPAGRAESQVQRAVRLPARDARLPGAIGILDPTDDVKALVRAKRVAVAPREYAQAIFNVRGIRRCWRWPECEHPGIQEARIQGQVARHQRAIRCQGLIDNMGCVDRLLDGDLPGRCCLRMCHGTRQQPGSGQQDVLEHFVYSLDFCVVPPSCMRMPAMDSSEAGCSGKWLCLPFPTRPLALAGCMTIAATRSLLSPLRGNNRILGKT